MLQVGSQQCRIESLPSTCWPHFLNADQDVVVDVALGVWTLGLFRVCISLRKQSREEKKKSFFVTCNKSLSQDTFKWSLNKLYFESWLVID